jgi:transcription elongation factor GreA
MEGRIAHLTQILENANIVDSSGSSIVTAGSIVTIRYEGDTDTERYLIGSIEERHADLDVISPGSPLGEAVVGSKVGDKVSFETPTGATLQVELIEIS